MNARKLQTTDPVIKFLDRHEVTLDGLNYKHLLAAHLVSPAGDYLQEIVCTLSQIFSNIHQCIFNNQNSNDTARMIKLADLLLKFKQHVENSGVLSTSQANETNPRHAERLKRNFNWLLYFHYVIENGLDRMRNDIVFEKTELAHHTLTNSLSKLQHFAYHFLKRNAPEVIEKYAAFRTEIAPLNTPFNFHNRSSSCVATSELSEARKPSVKRKAPGNSNG